MFSAQRRTFLRRIGVCTGRSSIMQRSWSRMYRVSHPIGKLDAPAPGAPVLGKHSVQMSSAPYLNMTLVDTQVETQPKQPIPTLPQTFEECLESNISMTPELEKLVDMYAAQQITSFSLKHQYRFGVTPAVKNLLASASFLQKEIPIRFAQRLSFFKDLPFKLHSHPLVKVLLNHYLTAFVQSVQGVHEDLEDFTERMEGVMHFSALLSGVEASRVIKQAAYETLSISYAHLFDPNSVKLDQLYASVRAGKTTPKDVWHYYFDEYSKTAMGDFEKYGEDLEKEELNSEFPQVSKEAREDVYNAHFAVVDEYIDLFHVARLETRLLIAQHVALCEQYVNQAELDASDHGRTLVNAGFVPSLGISRNVHFEVPLPPTLMQMVGRHNTGYYCPSGTLRRQEGQQTRPVGVAGWVGVIELAMSPVDVVACSVAIGMQEIIDKITLRGIIDEQQYVDKLKKQKSNDPSLPISNEGKIDLTLLQQWYQNQYAQQLEPFVNKHGVAKAAEQSPSPFGSEPRKPCDLFNDSWEHPLVLKAPEWLEEVINIKLPPIYITGELLYTCRYPRMHLTYVMVELMSNAIENTLFAAFNNNHPVQPQPVQVSIAQSNGIVTIRVCDYGGGISASNMRQIWAYGSSSIYCEQHLEKVALAINKPVHLFQDRLYDNGFGLPLARVVSRFLLGDLDIISLEDTGIIAYVTIKTMRALE